MSNLSAEDAVCLKCPLPDCNERSRECLRRTVASTKIPFTYPSHVRRRAVNAWLDSKMTMRAKDITEFILSFYPKAPKNCMEVMELWANSNPDTKQRMLALPPRVKGQVPLPPCPKCNGKIRTICSIHLKDNARAYFRICTVCNHKFRVVKPAPPRRENHATATS